MRINLKIEDPDLQSHLNAYPKKMRAEMSRKLMYLGLAVSQGAMVRASDTNTVPVKPAKKDIGALMDIGALVN